MSKRLKGKWMNADTHYEWPLIVTLLTLRGWSSSVSGKTEE
jgi:hypothetical protein